MAFIAGVLLMFFPFAKYFVASGTFYEFRLTGMILVAPEAETVTMIPVFLLSLLIILALMIFVSIFMFKNRVRQMRVVAVSFLLNAILIATLFYFADKFGGDFSTTPNYKNIGTLLPFVMLVMLLLANKAIKKDEIKMRKSSRIR